MSINIKGLEDIEDSFSKIQALSNNPNLLLKENIVVPIYNRSIKAFETKKSAFDNSSWKDLKAATKKRKKGMGSILYDSGNLQKRFIWEVNDNTAFIGTNATFNNYAYGEVHQFGSANGKIPKRAFLPIDDNGNLSEDVAKSIEQALKKKIEKL